MNIKGQKYNYDDVSIVPDVATTIKHRRECSCEVEEGMCPIWAAPMDTVISEDNWKVFYDANINVVIPRNVSYEKRISMLIDFSSLSANKCFVAFSLGEIKKLFRGRNEVTSILNNKNKPSSFKSFRICIDVANGHMMDQIDVISKIKKRYGEFVILMGGNIANPETYKLYDNVGCDYLRVGIGGGGACLVKGTMIRMSDGSEEAIEDLNIGDYVKTLNGNKKIINVFKKNVKKIISINDSIESTPDHNFLVVKKTDVVENMSDEDIIKKSFYVSASELNPDYMLIKE